MRILFLNTTGGYFGGVEQNIALAAYGLSSLGHTCYFASSYRSGVDQELFDSLFSQVWDVRITSLETLYMQLQPDVVYLHKWDQTEEVFRVCQSVRIVRMIHDHDLYCPRSHKYYLYNRHICSHRSGLMCYLDLAFIKKGAKGISLQSIRSHQKEMRRNYQLDACIVGSTYMQEELIRNRFPKERISLVAPCVEPFTQKEQPFPKEPSLLYIGQLIRGKGVDVLLRAHGILTREQEKPIQLDIVGAGNDLPRLQEVVSIEKTEKFVTFHGWVAHNDLVDFYDQSEIVVVPSIWPEPFGMVGVEAMLRGRPVVASRVGGIPDWLEDEETGFLFTVGSHIELAQKLTILIEDRQKGAEMGRKGRALALKKFSYDTYIHTLEKILLGEGI